MLPIDLRWKVVRLDLSRQILPGQPLGNTFQFVDIAWPRVFDEPPQGGRREPRDVYSCIMGQIVLEQDRDVFRAISQRWNDQMDDVEAIEKFFAEIDSSNPLEQSVVVVDMNRRPPPLVISLSISPRVCA